VGGAELGRWKRKGRAGDGGGVLGLRPIAGGRVSSITWRQEALINTTGKEALLPQTQSQKGRNIHVIVPGFVPEL